MTLSNRPGWWLRCLTVLLMGMALGKLDQFPTLLLAAEPATAPTSARPLDLSSAYQEKIRELLPSSPWSSLPTSTRNFDGVPFRLEGLIRLAGIASLKAGEGLPTEVRGIAVKQKAGALWILHGLEGRDRDGTPVMSLVFHYQDGSSETSRLAYGLQVASSIPERGETSGRPLDSQTIPCDLTGGVLKEASSPTARVFRTRVVNPRPDHLIESIDLLSLFPNSTDVVLGITIDTSSTANSSSRESVGKSRVEKRAAALSDEALRGSVTLEIRSAEGGAPVAGSEAFVSFSGDDVTTFLASGVSGPDGLVKAVYPRLHTVALSILVRAPGHAPRWLLLDRFKDRGIPGSTRVELSKGGVFGGVVQDASGKPIAGAKVQLQEWAASGRREFTRIDHLALTTDAAGRWSGQTLPKTIGAADLFIEHPDFSNLRLRVLTNEVAGNKVLQGVPLASLRAGEAISRLVPEPPIRLAVKNSDGKPLAGVQVMALQAKGKVGRRLGTTDASGNVTLRAVELTTAGRLLLMAPGYAPSVVFSEAAFNGGEAVPVLPVTLQRTQPLVGEVRDQNQRPVPDATVKVESWNDSDLLTWSGTTDANGRFVWSNAAPGQIFFRFSKPNYQRNNYQIQWQTGEVQFYMQRQSSLGGRVVDAETGRPIPDFLVLQGVAYGNGEPMRWYRYRSTRGRNGSFTARLDNYGSAARYAFMVEAPGYVPVISEEFNLTDGFQGEIRLKKGRGLSGRVVDAQGRPVSGAQAFLVEPPDLLSMDRPGVAGRSNSYSDQARTDSEGRFEFQPRIRPGRVVVVTSNGVADVPVSQVATTGVVAIEAWGRIEGVLKVGSKIETNQSVRIQTAYLEGLGGSEPGMGISLDYKMTPGPDGRFVFEKVPPGLRTASLEYHYSDRRGAPPALSHQVHVEVKPGATSTVTLGGDGRTVVGKVRILGDPDLVDWLADVHLLRRQPPVPPGMPSLSFGTRETQETMNAKQKAYAEAMQTFYQTAAGKAFQLAQRSLFLVFNTNGEFRIDSVPPGNYNLSITPNEIQTGDYYNYNQLGSLQQMVQVPEGPADKPFDLGTLDLRIRSYLKVGKRVPDFTLTTMDGKKITRADLAGKPAVIYFWSTWAGGMQADQSTLKNLANTLVKEEKISLLLVNVDNERSVAEEAIKALPIQAIQCYGGRPDGVSESAMMLGIEGYPSCVIIDAQGRAVVQNARGPSIQSFANKALRSSQSTNKLPDAAKPAR